MADRKQDWTSRKTATIRHGRAPEYRIPRSVLPELEGAGRRAVAAGAPELLDLVGVGMWGIVFCDEKGRAWKVGRLQEGRDPTFVREVLRDEFEWLEAAKGGPIWRNVVRVYAFHPKEVVIERDCVPGAPGTWADGPELHALHSKIEKVMLEVGWTAPEFKEDSYVYVDKNLPVLVDATGAQRVGWNLADYVECVLAGACTTRDRWHDLAFYLLREMRAQDHAVPRERALPLLERLAELDPEIRHSFRWDR